MASPPRRHPPPSSSPSPPSKPLPLEAEITVVSAKHLKNVNWRRGDLKPCAVLYLDPDNRVTTKADDSGSTTPVWNERFVLPVPQGGDIVLTLEIFHSKPSETSKPLVGTVRSPLWELAEHFPDGSGGRGGSGSIPIRTLELRRPSGRPQGKVRIKAIVREVPLPEPPAPPMLPPDYHAPPPPSFYYSSAPPPPSHIPPPPSVRDYSGYAPPPLFVHTHPPPSASQYSRGGYSDPYAGYYSGGYYSAPPPPARPFYDAASAYGAPSGPSAPVDYSSGPSYDQKPRDHSKLESGSGSAVGAVSGSFGGLSLREGSTYKEEKLPGRTEGDRMGRGDYSDHRDDY